MIAAAPANPSRSFFHALLEASPSTGIFTVRGFVGRFGRRTGTMTVQSSVAPSRHIALQRSIASAATGANEAPSSVETTMAASTLRVWSGK